MDRMKTAKLLSRIVRDRMEGPDIWCPAFTAAVDRLSEGCPMGLPWSILNAGNTGYITQQALWVWTDADCRLVFGFSRDEILDMIDGRL